MRQTKGRLSISLTCTSGTLHVVTLIVNSGNSHYGSSEYLPGPPRMDLPRPFSNIPLRSPTTPPHVFTGLQAPYTPLKPPNMTNSGPDAHVCRMCHKAKLPGQFVVENQHRNSAAKARTCLDCRGVEIDPISYEKPNRLKFRALQQCLDSNECLQFPRQGRCTICKAANFAPGAYQLPSRNNCSICHRAKPIEQFQNRAGLVVLTRSCLQCRGLRFDNDTGKVDQITRRCTKCHEEKSLDGFPTRRNSSTASICKTCAQPPPPAPAVIPALTPFSTRHCPSCKTEKSNIHFYGISRKRPAPHKDVTKCLRCRRYEIDETTKEVTPLVGHDRQCSICGVYKRSQDFNVRGKPSLNDECVECRRRTCPQSTSSSETLTRPPIRTNPSYTMLDAEPRGRTSSHQSNAAPPRVLSDPRASRGL